MCPPTRPNLNTLIQEVKEALTMIVDWGRCPQAQTHLCRGRRRAATGRETVKATTDGHVYALIWARDQFGDDLKWGIEDCRNMSGRLEHDLITADQKIVRVPTKLMARIGSRLGPGQVRPIDAYRGASNIA